MSISSATLKRFELTLTVFQSIKREWNSPKHARETIQETTFTLHIIPGENRLRAFWNWVSARRTFVSDVLYDMPKKILKIIFCRL